MKEEIYVTVAEHAHYLKKAEKLLESEQIGEIAELIPCSVM